MKHVFKLLLVVGAILGSVAAWAQTNVKIVKSEFKINPVGFAEAWENVQDGNKYFVGEKRFMEFAIDPYMQAYRYNNINAELCYKLGMCYLFSDQPYKAQEFLKKAYDIKAFVSPDIHYFLGVAYHVNADFDKAMGEYSMYRSGLVGEDTVFRPMIDRRIAECNNGKKFYADQKRIFVENAGSTINSIYDDYLPVLVKHDSLLYFTSRRETSMGKKLNRYNGDFFEDIFYTFYKSNQWQPAFNADKPINSKGNDALLSISRKRDVMLLYRGNENGGDIYFSTFVDSSWKKPKRFKKINTRRYKETSAVLTSNGRVIYFVSDRKDLAVGGKDIFVSYLDSTGKWYDPQNLSAVINTKYDEEGLFLTANDSVLYFSSKGHNSMGGYDIFRSRLQTNGMWSKPENLGYPINTPADEVFFALSPNERFAYFNSQRSDSKGGKDIYRAIFLGDEKDQVADNSDDSLTSAWHKKPVNEIIFEGSVAIQTIQLTVVKGTVTDFNTGEPIPTAVAEVVDIKKNESVSSQKVKPATGIFIAPLPPGRTYSVTVKADDYMFASENFVIPDSATGYNELPMSFALQPMSPGSKVILKNVFFESGKTDLRTESFPELDRVAAFFTDYPSLVLEISGHTDNIGSAYINEALSKQRAESVVKYLLQQGVDAKNLVAVGYGFKQPVAPNDTEEGRQKNRRVEIKILQK